MIYNIVFFSIVFFNIAVMISLRNRLRDYDEDLYSHDLRLIDAKYVQSKIREEVNEQGKKLEDLIMNLEQKIKC